MEEEVNMTVGFGKNTRKCKGNFSSRHLGRLEVEVWVFEEVLQIEAVALDRSHRLRNLGVQIMGRDMTGSVGT